MQLSGSMTRKFGPSWKQSTGHTSTQSVCLQLMQFSVTTWVTGRGAVGDTHSLAAPIVLGHDQLGRATCRERVCQYVSISVWAVSLQKKQQMYHKNTKS